RARRADDPGVGRPISRDLRARAGPRRSGTRAREFRMGDARLWIAPAAGSAAPPGASGRSALRFAMSGFWPFLLAVPAILLVAAGCGRLVVRALLPPNSGWSLERAGWSVAAGLPLVTANVCVCFALRIRPGWLSFLALAGIAAILAHRFAVPSTPVPVRA